jgi:NAD-dependent dihydropyrimidine dehydrogenase PreA subunit
MLGATVASADSKIGCAACEQTCSLAYLLRCVGSVLSQLN